MVCVMVYVRQCVMVCEFVSDDECVILNGTFCVIFSREATIELVLRVWIC